MQFRRDLRLDSRQHRLDPGNDVERRGISGFLNGQQGSPLSVDPNDVGLWREAVAHVGHVTDVDRRTPNAFDGKVVQLRHGLRAAVQVDVIFELADLGCSRGQNQVLGADGVDHIHRREAFRLQRVGVEIHLHLSLLAAIRVRNGCARNRDQPGANKIHPVVEELLLRKFLPRQGQLQNGHSGCVVGDDQRRRGARR